MFPRGEITRRRRPNTGKSANGPAAAPNGTTKPDLNQSLAAKFPKLANREIAAANREIPAA